MSVLFEMGPIKDLHSRLGIRTVNDKAQALLDFLSESLILAQNERWRQASYMQVER